MAGSVSQGWCHFGFYNTINIVLTDADVLRVQELIGTDSFDIDQSTGKPIPFKAYIKNIRYLPKTPGYQLVEIGLPDRNGAQVFDTLVAAGIVTGVSEFELLVRDEEARIVADNTTLKRAQNVMKKLLARANKDLYIDVQDDYLQELANILGLNQ